jgi:hypothetical protein
MPPDAPAPLRGSGGAMHFLARQPRRRRADDALGQPLYLPRAGLAVVPVARRGNAWECVVILSGRSVGGPRSAAEGHLDRVVATDIEIETALAVMILPAYEVDDPVDHLTLWLTRVWQRWPGGNNPRVAQALADAADPLSLTVALTDEVVRRIADQAHVRPVGLRRILAQLEAGGLLARLDERAPGERTAGGPFGRYALVIPA